jgi:hypothetical protein
LIARIVESFLPEGRHLNVEALGDEVSLVVSARLGPEQDSIDTQIPIMLQEMGQNAQAIVD